MHHDTSALIVLFYDNNKLGYSRKFNSAKEIFNLHSPRQSTNNIWHPSCMHGVHCDSYMFSVATVVYC